MTYVTWSHRKQKSKNPRIDYVLPIESEGLIKGLLMLYVKLRSSPAKSGPTIKYLFEMGFFVGQNYRRQGIAEEVVRKALPFAFNELNASSVHAICSEENLASKSLLRKLQFQERPYPIKNATTPAPLLVYVAPHSFFCKNKI